MNFETKKMHLILKIYFIFPDNSYLSLVIGAESRC